MQFLLEQNQPQSRKLFIARLLIALVLAPAVLYFVGRSMSSLHPKPPDTPSHTGAISSTWDLRNMWY